jgi:hypothetical protein
VLEVSDLAVRDGSRDRLFFVPFHLAEPMGGDVSEGDEDSVGRPLRLGDQLLPMFRLGGQTGLLRVGFLSTTVAAGSDIGAALWRRDVSRPAPASPRP